MLINHKAKIGLGNKLSQILLYCSACLEYEAVTKLLINRGSVIITEDNNQYTARDLAKGSDHEIKALNSKKPDFYIYRDHIILL